MATETNREGDRHKEPGKPYDLTEQASRREGDPGATKEARRQESDDVNEETNLGFVSSPDGDSAGENRVSTSISDD